VDAPRSAIEAADLVVDSMLTMMTMLTKESGRRKQTEWREGRYQRWRRRGDLMRSVKACGMPSQCWMRASVSRMDGLSRSLEVPYRHHGTYRRIKDKPLTQRDNASSQPKRQADSMTGRVPSIACIGIIGKHVRIERCLQFLCATLTYNVEQSPAYITLPTR
jgi:hypothetical protein